MSNIEPVNTQRLIKRVILAAILVLIAGGFGLWVGKVSVPDDVPDYEQKPGGPKRVANAAKAKEADLSGPVPPLYFLAGAVEEEDLPVVLDEVKLAAGAGVDQVILPITLDWEGTSDFVRLKIVLERVIDANPKARVLVSLKLDPSKAWAAMRPTEVLTVAADQSPLGAPYSELWREETAKRAARLAKDISQEKVGRHVRGYLLTALKEGRWELPADAGAATCASKSFREWLRRRYVENDALRTAWGNQEVTIDTAETPTVAKAALGQMFLTTPAQQSLADYHEFLSASTADAIAAIMNALKQSVAGTKVFAMYGHAFEVVGGTQGMLGMGRLLYSDLDGFAGPVSASDRGIGAAGGLCGATFSAALHQKQWIVIDDTRTGVGRDAATGQIARLQGIRSEDVYNVQRRNFALALVQGLGVAWSDPQGEGWLHEEEQWAEFGHMREIYAGLYPPVKADPAAAAAKGSHAASSEAESDRAEPMLLARLEHHKPEPEKKPPPKAVEKKKAPEAKKDTPKKEAKKQEPPKADEKKDVPPPAEPAPVAPPTPALQAVPVGPPNNFPVGLALVIDEGAINYLAAGDVLHDRLTLPARDAAMRSGAAVRVCLLQDVLDDIAPAAQVYLFVNAFRLGAAERDRLHARLQRDQACAIWCYAPGYLSPDASTEAVSKTVGMNVIALKARAQAGSTFTLGGRWLHEGAAIGEAAPFDPLFSIEDDNADVIAQYKAGQKGSIAVRVMPEGWTSIYVAEPTMSPALLRELLRVIEQRIYFRITDREHFDTAYVGLNIVAIHAKQPGEIPLSLGNVYDIQDLFDKGIGWSQKESITLPVKTGETRLLKLTPVL